MSNYNADARRRIDRSVRQTELAPSGGIGPRAQGPRQSAPRPRWYWTTSVVGAASESGTTLTTAGLQNGTGTARRCVLNSSGVKVPDTSAGAADVEIENPTQNDLGIGRFYRCTNVDGRLEVDMSSRCS